MQFQTFILITLFYCSELVELSLSKELISKKFMLLLLLLIGGQVNAKHWLWLPLIRKLLTSVNVNPLFSAFINVNK